MEGTLASFLGGYCMPGEPYPWCFSKAGNGAWQLPRSMGLSGPAVISRDRLDLFRSLSVKFPNSPADFPCTPFIYQEVKLVTAFFTLPNLTDEICLLPKFRRSINYCWSALQALSLGTPIQGSEQHHREQAGAE